MGSVYAKPSSSRMMKKQHGSRSSDTNTQSFSLTVPVLIKGIVLALAASSLPLLVFYTLPSLKLFLFEVIPTLWRCSSDLFTPKTLFVLLNLIILSILAMTHLHPAQDSSASASLRVPLHSVHHDVAQETTHAGAVNRSLSQEFKLDSADLQLVDEVNSADDQIGDQLQPTKHGADKDDYHNNRAITGVMVIQGTIIETRKAVADRKMAEKAKTGLSEPAENAEKGKNSQCEPAESEKAERSEKARAGKSAAAESRKAEKARSMRSPLQPNNSFYDIDSLLSEEGSIFTRVESRPLPSARFSPKKAPKLSGLDRPLSPLRMSRPILKRGDTIDATWKAICESKRHSSPLNRHHSSKHTRKEDILEGVANKPLASSPSPLSPLKQRSKILMSTFHNKGALEKANPLNTREPSMPQEELNAKVESFISRFNEQIRIQREKSLLDYMEMVGRGSS